MPRAQPDWKKTRAEYFGAHVDIDVQRAWLRAHGAVVPAVDFAKQDLYDRDRVVTPDTARRDYADGRDDVDAFFWYLPFEKLPTPVLAEDHDEDPEMHGSYDWSGMSPRAAMPPAKVWADGGRFRIVDGNHRLTLWERAGMTHAPVIVLAPGGHRAAVKAALRAGRKVPAEVVAEYPDLARHARTRRGVGS